ncbi:hypothetical protein [Gardnerella vaginalis]
MSNSSERARIWLNTRHQDEAVEPYRISGAPLQIVTVSRYRFDDIYLRAV